MTSDPVARAFETLGTLPPLERGFLQHVLMQALNVPDLVADSALADNLQLLPQVLRALPLETAFVRKLNERPDLEQWADTALRTIAGTVAVTRPTSTVDGLVRLSHLSLRDSPFVASFLEDREPAEFIDERFLSSLAPRKPAKPNGIDVATFPAVEGSRILEIQAGSWLLYEVRAKSGGGVYVGWDCGVHGGARETLLVRSDPRSIAEYLGQRLTTRELLVRSNDDVGFLFTATPGHEGRARIVAVSALPEAYLPSLARRHTADMQPPWDDVPQSFLVEENWSPELFKELEKSYLNVFSLTYFLDPTADAAVHRLTASELDGYAYGNLYKTLRNALPANETAKATRLAAASPGVLTIAASRKTSQRVAIALQVIRSESAIKAYRVLHDWSRLNETEADQLPPTALDDVRRLSNMLMIDAMRLLPEGHDKKQLLRVGKIVASYYRQLVKLAAPPAGVEFLAPHVEGSHALAVAIAGETGDDLDDEFSDDSGDEFEEN